MSNFLSRIFQPAPNAAPAPNTSVPASPDHSGPGGTSNVGPTVGTVDNKATAPNGAIPNDGSATKPADNSPLAEFNDLWENTANNGDSSNTPAPANFDLKPEEVQKIVQAQDFSKFITPDIKEAIAEGGEAAFDATTKLMSTMAQQTLTSSILVANSLAKKMTETALEQWTTSLPDHLKREDDRIYGSDNLPIFNNPAVKPIIDATRERLREKNPDATPAQVNEMTRNFILAMGKEFAPQDINPTAKDDDWTDYFGFKG